MPDLTGESAPASTGSVSERFVETLATRLSLGDVRPRPSQARQAAVAVVLHHAPTPRVLLMKRAERIGDPWSGHISLPGGGFHASDGDLRVTAIRESREELGIELAGARLLGNLPTLHPRSSGGPKQVEVTPFVFVTDVALEPVCGPEALAAFWLPLSLAASGAIDSTYHIPAPQGPGTLQFPSWIFEGHVIWGLTRRILDDLLASGR
ncbi:MAG TPA: CoA pyrophosphatase [Kofleriaceae bacterium]|nr:CoA pyrophosphatase [Kofleriaceae bacterium]